MAKQTLARKVRWFLIRPVIFAIERLEHKIMSALSDIVAKTISDAQSAIASRDAQIAALTTENASLKADSADAEAAVTALTQFDTTLMPVVPAQQ